MKQLGNNSCYIHQYYNKSDAKTIYLVLSVFVVSLPRSCGVVIAVDFVRDSTDEVWVRAVPLKALLCEVSDTPCCL